MRGVWHRFNSFFTNRAQIILELKQANQELSQLALFDSLTGLYNRHQLDRILPPALQQAKKLGHPLSLLLFDLDRFKEINDRFGHLKGDEVLKQIGKFIQAVIRKDDFCFRYGGDEFLILLIQPAENTAEQIIQRLQEKTKQWLEQANLGVSLSFCVGASRWSPGCKEDVDGFLRRADDALYQQKQSSQSALHKQTQRALEESEEKYRLLVELSPEAIFVHTDGKFVYCNPAGVQLLGAGHLENIIGKSIWDFVPSNQQEIVRGWIHQTQERRDWVRCVEEQLVRLDGQVVDVEVSGMPIAYLGKPSIQAVIRDISERRRFVEHLKESQAKYYDLFDSASDVILLADYMGNLLDINRRGEQVTGYTRDELLKMNVLNHLVAESDHPVIRQVLKDVFQGKECIYEVTWRRKDGSPLYFEGASTARRAANGAVLSTRCTLRDITERKRVERALQESEKRYRSLYKKTAAMLHSCDPNGKIVDVSDRWLLTLGYERDEVLGKEPLEFLTEASKRHAEEVALPAFNEEGYAHDVPYQFIRKNGEIVDILLSSFIEYNRNREAVRTHTVLVDVTKQKRAQKKIEQQIQWLNALRDIDQVIIGDVDLKNMLSVILAQIQTQLHVDAACVLLVDPTSKFLKYAQGCGFLGKTITRSHVRLGEGLAGHAALRQETIGIPDLAKAPESQREALSRLTDEPYRAYYCVPLVAKGKLSGVLEVFNRTPLVVEQDWLDFLLTLSGQTAIAINNAMLVDHLRLTNAELSKAYNSTLEGWVKALEMRDDETEGHAQRVAEMTIKLSKMMRIPDEQLEHIKRGALLHDIGKMAVPDYILLKPEKLDEAEWAIMHQHPLWAYEWLCPIEYLHPALDIPYCHHEKWDGTGYPRGLKGEDIPLVARIFAVVDVWDALGSDRPYRDAWEQARVIEYIKCQSGKHFDPAVVDVFLKLLNKPPIKSTTR